MEEESCYRNLVDAGCGEETARKCAALVCEGKRTELLRTLAVCRGKLLEEMHESERKLERLDYFLYTVQKNQNGEETK